MTRRHVACVAVLLAGLLAACGSTANRGVEQAVTTGGDAPTLASEAGGEATGATTVDPAAVAGSGAAGASGSSGSTSGAGGATATTASGDGGASRAAITDPIELGFVTTATSNAGAFGFETDGSISERDVVEALVAAYNAQGGIAGRQIVPVYAETDTGSSSWEADFAAACAAFTEDHHVAAVLGYVFNHSDSFESCLATDGITHISTTFNVPDAEALRGYPLLVTPSTPTIEHRSIAKIDGALAAGVLDGASRLGVVVDSCPSTQRAWTSIIRPYLDAHGVMVASEFELGCANGSGEAASEAGRVASLLLQFRNAGVDRVAFMAVSEGPALFVIANAAEGQGWRPTYIVSSLAQTAFIVDQIPASQAANVHGFGWLPVMDVKPGQWPALPVAAERCLTMLEGQGVVPIATTAFAFAFDACEAMFLYETALVATAGHTDGPAVISAIEALGSGYQSAINLGGQSRFGPDRHDGPSAVRHFAWDPACSCFTYRQLSVPIA